MIGGEEMSKMGEIIQNRKGNQTLPQLTKFSHSQSKGNPPEASKCYIFVSFVYHAQSVEPNPSTWEFFHGICNVPILQKGNWCREELDDWIKFWSGAYSDLKSQVFLSQVFFPAYFHLLSFSPLPFREAKPSLLPTFSRKPPCPLSFLQIFFPAVLRQKEPHSSVLTTTCHKNLGVGCILNNISIQQ